MPEKLIQAIVLDNHLNLEIWDLSRVLAGDRWLVCLEARMDISLEMKYFDSLPEKEKLFSVMEKIYGPEVPYRYKEEKHFVDQSEKDELVHEFIEMMKENLVPYLSHPDFSRRFIMSRLKELRTKQPQLFSSE
ncbi:MAG: hypothetical protein JSW15_07230 [Deltaproteobacteria bacterium]|nr:MAG: hypothetical protein JSW15_07230 [Deltaproteobacteria bacterium]